jgi:lipid-A-disaccharide synthase-like uncharacterized protein
MRDVLWSALNVGSWTEFYWVLIGLTGQLLFTARFLVQWLASEREKRSVIPVAFWYFSLAGGCVLFTYAVWRMDPVFILGQSMGLVIYLRNLWLIHAEQHRDRATAET